MNIVDREALRWARFLASKKQRSWLVMLFLVAAGGLLVLAWKNRDVQVAWIALVFVLLTWIQFERCGFALLRQRSEVAEGERKGRTPIFALSFLALAILIWFTIKRMITP